VTELWIFEVVAGISTIFGFLMLVMLKLFGTLTLSWWIVATSFLWIPAIVGMLGITVMFIGSLVMTAYDFLRG
jgi:hypothetical protein